MFTKECEIKIQKKFSERMKRLGSYGTELSEKIAGQEFQTGILLQYMYGVMPDSDIGNYTLEMLTDFAEHGVYLWNHSPLIHKEMEEDFLQYTVFHRINNEEIRACRKFFYKDMLKWIQGKNDLETALAVNYWCAANATYQSSDDRTLSALAVYESASGRCGEESTFLTNALRSAGFMARQVYAQKWSHCDDNHAWSEVYVDGKWKFLGACEPEEILNKGWFLSAASRAMVIQSKYFGEKEDSEINSSGALEEITETDGIVTMLSQLPRYANIREVVIKVVDLEGNKIPNAAIYFQIVNYAELATIAKLTTDKSGRVKLSMGKGDIILRVCKESMFAEKLLSVNEEQAGEVQVVLDNTVLKEEFDVIAPVDAPLHFGILTDAQKKAGKDHLAEVNKKRIVKSQTFHNVHLENFIEKKDHAKIRKELLEVLTPKDKRDLQAGILEEHLEYAMPFSEVPHFIEYVLNPRIDNEPLSNYRAFINLYFNDEQKDFFRDMPLEIWNWIIEHITYSDVEGYSELITEPAACLKMKKANLLSCKILFVAIARTLGIPSGLRAEDKAIEFWDRGKFVPAMAENRCKATLILHKSDENKWTYRTNWSLAKLENEIYTTINLQHYQWVNTLKICIPAGCYRLLTSNRLPNGNIFAKKIDFIMQEEEQLDISLELRQANLADMLENISIRPFSLLDESGKSHEAKELMKNGKKIFLFLEESKEPTEHILNEMMDHKETFTNISSNIYFIVRDVLALEDPTLSKCLKEIPGVQVYYDDFSEIINVLGRAIYVDPAKLPLIMVTNGELNSIYGTSGYNVGTADMLLRIMQF